MGCISRKELIDIKDKFEWLKTFFELEIEKKRKEIGMLKEPEEIKTYQDVQETMTFLLDETDRLRRRVWTVIKEMEEAKVEEICTLK